MYHNVLCLLPLENKNLTEERGLDQKTYVFDEDTTEAMTNENNRVCFLRIIRNSSFRWVERKQLYVSFLPKLRKAPNKFESFL